MASTFAKKKVEFGVRTRLKKQYYKMTKVKQK